MYNFDYTLFDYTNDEEYQKEFLHIFNLKDIMDEELNEKLNEILYLVKDNDDWKKLLLKCSSLFPFNENPSLELGLPIAFSFEYFKKTHECLREFKFKQTTFLVQDLIETFDKK